MTYALYMHNMNMKVVWDSVKAKINRLKHGIYFSEVEPVFYDPRAISFEDPDSTEEARYVVIGLDSVGRVIVVVYNYRDNAIRLISARKASKAERKVYEK